MEDFEEDDEVEFNTRITFHYDLEASNGLTGEEEVIMPHMFILTMFLSTIADKPKLAGLVGTKTVLTFSNLLCSFFNFFLFEICYFV